MTPRFDRLRPAQPAGRPVRSALLGVGLLIALVGQGRTSAAEAVPEAVSEPAAAGQASSEPTPEYEPTSAYEDLERQGWRVRVNRRLLAEGERCARTLQELERQLERIARVVPPGPLARLRSIPIWVEHSSRQFACMCYHESRDWLRAHGVNPDKTGAVELANPETFLRWTREQPWMVLHELAHGYHQRVLGEDDPALRRCFEQAGQRGQYAAVRHVTGRTLRHYALTNLKEYFAEGTEAFFGTNDFYPFIRAELRQHDPELAALLAAVWEVPDDAPAPAPAKDRPADNAGP